MSQSSTLLQPILDAIISGKSVNIENIKPEGRISAATRLEVYANNYSEALIQVLAITYPTVKAVVGEECFRMLAKEYIRMYPPVSTFMDAYGERFTLLIKDHASVKALTYLPEVATFEWLLHRSEMALPEPVMTTHTAASLTPEALLETRFTPHPSLELFHSPFAIDAIWKAAAESDSGTVEIGKPCNLAITTVEGRQEVRSLDSADFAMLKALAQGKTLTEAYGLAVGANAEATDFTPEFALAICLKNHIVSGSFTGIR